MAPKYIDLGDVHIIDYTAGVGFLIETRPQGKAPRFEVHPHPGHTNQSHEPRLSGWLGETNNVSSFARGVVRCVGRSDNDRVSVEPLDGDSLRAALATLCYPELDPGNEPEPEAGTKPEPEHFVKLRPFPSERGPAAFTPTETETGPFTDRAEAERTLRGAMTTGRFASGTIVTREATS